MQFYLISLVDRLITFVLIVGYWWKWGWGWLDDSIDSISISRHFSNQLQQMSIANSNIESKSKDITLQINI